MILGRYNNRRKKTASLLAVVFSAVLFAVIPLSAHAIPSMSEMLDGLSALIDLFTSGRLIANIAFLFLTIISGAVTLTGAILEKSIQLSILHFGDLAGATGIVGIGWEIVRDLSNLVFIFLILWVAISTILGLNHGSAMGTIIRIVIAAVLINFSLFITKAVIDVANIVALHFYNLIIGSNDGSLSGVFMRGFQVQGIFDGRSVDLSTGAPFKIIAVSVYGSIMLLVAAWIFLAAAVMMITRTIYLVFLMILSPFAFIAWVIPGMGGYTHEWWNKLFKQAFYAPIFMIMIYIIGKAWQDGGLNTVLGSGSTTMATAFNGISSGASSSQIIGQMGIFVNFMTFTGLLVATLIVANSLGAKGASTMISWGKKLQGIGQGVVGSYSVGKIGALIQDKYGDKWRASNNIGQRLLLRTTNAMQEQKWGQGSKSYKDYKEKGSVLSAGEEEVKKNMDKLENNPTEFAKYFSRLSAEQRKYAYKSMSARNRVVLQQAVAGQLRDRADNLSPAIAGLDQSLAVLSTKLSPEEREKTEKATREAGRVDEQRQIRNTLGAFVRPLTEAMNALSVAQVAGNAAEVARLQAEIPRIEANIRTNHEQEIRTRLQNLQSGEVSNMSMRDLQALAPYLSTSQYQKTKDSLTTIEQNHLEIARFNNLATAAGQNISLNNNNQITVTSTGAIDETALQNQIRQMDPRDIAEMDASLLRVPAIIKNLSRKNMDDLLKRTDLDSATRQSVRRTINDLILQAAGGTPVAQAGTLQPNHEQNIQDIEDWLQRDPRGRNFV